MAHGSWRHFLTNACVHFKSWQTLLNTQNQERLLIVLFFFVCLYDYYTWFFFSLRFTECLCWWSDVLFIFCWNVGTIDKIFLMYTKQKQWKKCSNEINCEKYTVLDSNSCVCVFFLYSKHEKNQSLKFYCL